MLRRAWGEEAALPGRSLLDPEGGVRGLDDGPDTFLDVG